MSLSVSRWSLTTPPVRRTWSTRRRRRSSKRAEGELDPPRQGAGGQDGLCDEQADRTSSTGNAWLWRSLRGQVQILYKTTYCTSCFYGNEGKNMGAGHLEFAVWSSMIVENRCHWRKPLICNKQRKFVLPGKSYVECSLKAIFSFCLDENPLNLIWFPPKKYPYIWKTDLIITYCCSWDNYNLQFKS